MQKSFHLNVYLVYLPDVRNTSMEWQLRDERKRLAGNRNYVHVIVCSVDVYVVLLVAPVGTYLEALAHLVWALESGAVLAD